MGPAQKQTQAHHNASTLHSTNTIRSPVRCGDCDREFCATNALTMHLRTAAHRNKSRNATQGLPKSDLVDRGPPPSISMEGTTKLAVSTREDVKAIPTKHHRKTVSVHACFSCNREFVNAMGLRMHKRTSKKHKENVIPVGPSTPSAPTKAAPSHKAGARPMPVAAAGTDLPKTQPSKKTPRSNFDNAPSQLANLPWSTIVAEERMEVLSSILQKCHSLDELTKNHYLLEKDISNNINDYVACTKCGTLQMDCRGKREKCWYHPSAPLPMRALRKPKNTPDLIYLCCFKQGRGCAMTKKHVFKRANPQNTKRDELSPRRQPSQLQKRRVVALDCEMVGVASGYDEVVSLGAVDVLTGDVLINALVVPTETVIAWRTSVSGVTPEMLRGAVTRGEALIGWQHARTELWKHIDAETILVGHSLNHDLRALHMVHTTVVDSAILTKSAVDPKCPRTWGLKSLCEELLSMEIQTGKGGHDCLEDTFAAREVVLWCLRNPDLLDDWAERMREILASKESKKGKKSLNTGDSEDGACDE
ncbi:hypothetical protein AJ80_06591 [Polytolypa hystricis UAMH7299]|uniref:C2H2-type domain-containing protein n=1 Tax=Polytolypa hystricis (strain UAMH7299) TaxID=1447883 RepID=A0A2B7XW88_POLH7|nr:hypothetical protein AJ80_06591 [Polytolypa hystricis UAMH7299]